MKLWDKGQDTDAEVLAFTVGNDRELDLRMARFDILGSIAHARMLEQTGLLPADACTRLVAELRRLYQQTQDGTFVISEQMEDVHSQVEHLLTQALGPDGERIHTARSRNDQSALDVRMYLRWAVGNAALYVHRLADQLLILSDRHADILMPGYTHLQVAMPSSVGLWLGAYAESLTDDLEQLLAVYRLLNRSPLGSAASYGSSLPIDRDLTARLLGFEGPVVNSLYAQMGRGKMERLVASAFASVAHTVGRLAHDACLYAGQEFRFLQFPDAFTTGSSIMPHKKNPDVLELVRCHCARLQALPTEAAFLSHGLPAGYHRDMQLTKDMLFPAHDTLCRCLYMTDRMFEAATFRTGILEDKQYDLLFTVEAVNERVLKGVPFRQAYREVAKEIEAGTYTPNRALKHTHLGSIGNLGNDRIEERLNFLLSEFPLSEVEAALDELAHGQ